MIQVYDSEQRGLDVAIKMLHYHGMVAAVKTSYSLPEQTKRRIEEIAELAGMTQTQVIVVAIDRMWREEEKPEK